jgi:MFS family permease
VTGNGAQRRQRTFYVLVASQALSLIGSRISGLAVSIWIYRTTGDVTPLALVSFFFIVPQILAAGFAGALADRLDRKTVMILSDSGVALGTLLLLFSFTTGSFELWHLYPIVVIQSVFEMFYGPALIASVTMLVPDESRDRANAIMQMAQPLAGIVAMAVAGMLYAIVGVIGCFLIDLMTFLIAVCVLLTVNIPRAARSMEGRAIAGSIWSDTVAGFRYLWARPALMLISLWAMPVNFFLGVVLVLETPYILARTGSETALGIALALANTGALVGGMVMAAWGGTRPRIHTMMIGAATCGLFLAAVGFGHSAIAIGGALFAFMFAIPFVSASSMSISQAKVAPDVQGRVFAASAQLSMLMLPAASLISGPLADQVFEPAVSGAGWAFFKPLFGDGPGSGMGAMFFISGIVTTVLSLITYAIPLVRNLERDLPDHSIMPQEAQAAE